MEFQKGPSGIITSEQARALAERRKPKERCCPVCGNSFTTIGRGLYDSPKCAGRAGYLRRRERLHKLQQTAFVTNEEAPVQVLTLKEPEASFVSKIHSLLISSNLNPQEVKFIGRILLSNARTLVQELREKHLP